MQPRIAVLGAGGIGGTIAAYLLRAGHDVTVIDQWVEHVDTIRRVGLTLTAPDEEFTVPASALQLGDVSGLSEPFDVVFLSVKSYDTIWCTHLIAPHLKPSGFVLPAMNALNDETVAQIVGYHRTVGCVVTISGAVYEPGHVVRTDPPLSHAFSVGELSGIITPRVQWTVDALQTIGPSEPTSNVWGVRWSKMVWNCIGNALSGLMGPAASDLSPAQRDLFGLVSVAIGCEASKVAVQMGIVLETVNGLHFEEFAVASTHDEFWALKAQVEAARAGRRLTAEQIHRLGAPGRPSLLQDVIKGRRTEVDYLNGAIVRLGAELGIATPMNRAIIDLMHNVEAGLVKPGVENLQRLAPHLSTTG